MRCPYIDEPMEPESICSFEEFREQMKDTRDNQIPDKEARCYIVISSKECYGQCAIALFTGEIDSETKEAIFVADKQRFKGWLWYRIPDAMDFASLFCTSTENQ